MRKDTYTAEGRASPVARCQVATGATNRACILQSQFVDHCYALGSPRRRGDLPRDRAETPGRRALAPMVEAELPSQLAVQQGVGCPPRDPLQPEAARAIDDQGYQLGEGQHTIVVRPVLHTPYWNSGAFHGPLPRPTGRLCAGHAGRGRSRPPQCGRRVERVVCGSPATSTMS